VLPSAVSDTVLAAAVGPLVMAVVWFVQRRTGNAGIVDVAWTFGVGVLGATYAIFGGDASWERRLLVAALISLWALRLGSYVLWRVWTQPEDGRYVALKRDWGPQAQRKLFLFFQYQAIGAVLFAIPMLFAARNQQPFGWFDGLAVAIWLVAIVVKAWPINSWPPSELVRAIAAAFVVSGFGAIRGIRIISSNGCTGGLTSRRLCSRLWDG